MESNEESNEFKFENTLQHRLALRQQRYRVKTTSNKPNSLVLVARIHKTTNVFAPGR